MIAKLNTNSYIDVEQISYIEAMINEEGEIVGAQLILNGSPLTFHDVKIAKRVLDSYLWQHQNGIYNMMEDTDGYRKKIMN